VTGTAAASSAPAALSLGDASMAFAGVAALRRVSLTVAPGEIRALVGKNGSGKSTLIKILSGYHRPASGTTLAIGGEHFAFPLSPEKLRTAGLAFVHQDLGLVAEASILDNVLVGRFAGGRAAPIAWRRERERVRTTLARFGLDLDPSRPVSALSPSERAFVAIARGFIDAGGPAGRVIVLDEPSAFLPEADVARLFAGIRSLAASGRGVIYVSHRLDEVLEIAHSVTVLRDGALVHEGPVAGLGEDDLVRHILGEDVRTFYPALAPAREELALSVRELDGETVGGASFTVRRGEIVGLTGLAGAGHEELPYLIAGARRAAGGVVRIGERKYDARVLDPIATRAAGLALLPADRQKASGAQEASVRENVSLPVLARFARFGTIRAGLERLAAERLLHAFDVRPARSEAPLRTLSGGNQQKALLGKWMQTAPSVLVLHEPTQGVDVGSKQDIFRRIEEIAASGVAVLIASSEAEDLARLCHRVAVLRRGRIAGVLAGPDLTETAIADLGFRDRDVLSADERQGAHAA